jgi:hypothetical protein
MMGTDGTSEPLPKVAWDGPVPSESVVPITWPRALEYPLAVTGITEQGTTVQDRARPGPWSVHSSGCSHLLVVV